MGKKASLVSSAMEYDDAQWRAQRDMECLIEAEKINADPKRLKAAKAAAREQLKRLQPVAGGEK